MCPLPKQSNPQSNWTKKVALSESAINKAEGRQSEP
jgi:hypothetical protein